MGAILSGDRTYCFNLLRQPFSNFGRRIAYVGMDVGLLMALYGQYV